MLLPVLISRPRSVREGPLTGDRDGLPSLTVYRVGNRESILSRTLCTGGSTEARVHRSGSVSLYQMTSIIQV